MYTASSGLPPRPFFEYGPGTFPALSDSRMTSAPLRAGTPKGPAAAPERNVTIPILNGFSAAGAGAGACARAEAGARAKRTRRGNPAQRRREAGIDVLLRLDGGAG